MASTTTSPSVFKLSPGIQSYAWGKKGSASLAAQFGTRCIEGFEVDESKTYAELWMGTHPTLPSHLASSSSTTLANHLKSHNELIGSSVIDKFPDSKNGNLPFLFKVLSIGTALSIQAHPDKQLGERLYKERGDVYKDPNHKPEMAIALTPFLAFLNFLPCQTILLHLLTVPELSRLIPETLITALATSLTLPTTTPPDAFLFQPTRAPPSDAQKEALKGIFEALMTAKEADYKSAIESLIKRYQAGEDIKENEKDLVELTIMLNEQYPGDVGVLCVFLLNVVELKEGEAAFLGANMPHAYIKGDIIECMATSDNVVRAGLTPKLRDVDTLISMLTYEAGPAANQLLKPSQFGSEENDSSSLLYDPPIDEFSVVKVDVAKGGETSHRAVEGPSICIVTKGSGHVSFSAAEGGNKDDLEVKRGDVVYIGAGSEVSWKSEEEGLELFRAFVEA